MSPPHNGNGAPAKEPRESAAAKLQVLAERNRQRRQDALRRALKDARRRQDRESVALLLQWLSDEAAA